MPMGYVSASDVVWLKSSDSYHFSFIWLILGLWQSPLNYEGFTADASGKARFSGKIPQRSEDDFFRNQWHDLAVRKEAFANFAL